MSAAWFTAAEVSALRLPGLSISERAIQLRAKRENWQGRAAILARGDALVQNGANLSQAIGAVVTMAFATCGACDIWYADNGPGFNNRLWDNQLTGLVARLAEMAGQVQLNDRAIGKPISVRT